MVICETPDFAFPMLADVYHPIVEQGAYGNVKKTWVLDRTIACSFNAAGTAFKEEVILLLIFVIKIVTKSIQKHLGHVQASLLFLK
ncbi:MAG: hypothetical protein EBV27_06760 [Actinobacteria bacterium]|nr:hypothetical protein [Actinomycetota bacterium]